MLNQERGIFKPSLKSHSLLNNPTLKRYSFLQPIIQQDLAQDYSQINSQPISYPNLDERQSGYPSKFWSRQPQNRRFGTQKIAQSDFQNPSSVTVTRFDPILPKFLFKRFVADTQLPQNQAKPLNNKIIQQLKIKNVNYPFEVEQMFKEVEDKKIIYKKSIQNLNSSSMVDQKQNLADKGSVNSYKEAFSGHTLKGLTKIPYFPLMGTNGSIFWSFSIDKVILWRYRMEDFSNQEVFCILNFDKDPAPISAVYATQIQSSIFKHERNILISIAFFDQLQFFSFDIQKYERECIFKYGTNQKTEEDFKKYVEKIMVKVNSKFLIEKILIQNIPNHQSSNKYLRPLVIFTDGGKDIEIVDLENLAAYKSHSQFDPFTIKRRNKANQVQNQIIKLLHCRDDNNPMIHYAFVLKKQSYDQEVKPKTFLQKVKNVFSKRYEKKQQMVLSIFEWNETELKNDTIWKKVWNPQRVRKIKEITSSDLEIRLKQNFFDFYRLNINNEFTIADMSLIEKRSNLKLFQSSTVDGCYLKVTFTNGTSVLISNFRTLTFASKVKVNPYIQKIIPLSACQYNNYRKLLDKGKYLQTQNQVKNKFNLFIYEPIESEKQPKFSRIDPVVSQCDGLTICEGNIIFEDQMQILYDFRDSITRKRIHQLKERKNSQKKSFMIFENSFITIVQTPNIASNFLVIGYLHKKYPDFKVKIKQYANSLFVEFSEQQKINLIESVIELLMQIESSGKGKQTNTQSKLTFNELIKGFQAKENKLPDETTYIEQRELNPQTLQDVYAYEVDINKADYQNLVEYVLGSDVLAKEKQNLKNMNSSYNGKTFRFKVTEHVFQFVMELLVEHGIKELSDKHVKTTNNVMEISPSLSKYISFSVTNSNDQNYLTNLFTGMFEIKESFIISGLSKYIMGLIEPVLDLSYKDFHKVKPLINIVGQKLQEVNNFLQKFVHHCSFKNSKVNIFEETVLFCKSLNNSLPKIYLLLRLFESLSQVEYCNPSLQNMHKNHWNEVTLKNLLFKVGTKQILSRITVEVLFDENSMMLDELEQKLPELNDIKYLRFYLGWKKINSKIIQNSQVKVQQNSKQSNAWFLNFFSNELPRKASKKSLLFEKQQQRVQEIIAKKKQQFLSIEKALTEYSYENFERFFMAKNQYSDFVNILLSKIYYLQINYLDLKDKYNFNEEGYQNFNEFMKTSRPIEKNQSQIKMNPIQAKKLTQNLTFKSFLKYEQKVCGHQKYLKTYSLIKFFNQKILFFFDKVVSIYRNECQKVSKELLSTLPTKQIEWSRTNGYQNQGQSNKYETMMDEVQRMVDLLLSQGSELMKSEIAKKLRGDSLLESFITKGKHGMQQEINRIPSQNERVNLMSAGQNDYLVKNKLIERGLGDMTQLREEQERRKMYEQKINEQISRQLKGGYVVSNDTNWMKKHNYKSEEAFKYQHL